MIPFKVNDDKVDDAKIIIHKLISNVRENEPGVLLYKSLQSKEDPTTFIHFIIFKDGEAQMQHRQANYVVEFIKDLYAVCPADPHPGVAGPRSARRRRRSDHPHRRGSRSD